MEKQKVKLFQTRDFGQNLQVTMEFLKQNYINISKGLCYLIPFFLIVAYLQPDFSAIFSYKLDPADPFGLYKQIYTLPVILGYILTFVGSTIIMAYMVSYIALYNSSEKGAVEIRDVWIKTIKVALPMMLCQIIYVIIIAIGSIFCIIPGVAFAIFFLFFAYVYIIEDASIVDSFIKSWKLVVNNWWTTFAFALLISLCLVIASNILSIPATLIYLGSMFKIDFFLSPIYQYVASAISYVGSIFLYPILFAGLGILYFNLRSRYENIDTYEEIDNLGNNN